MSPIVSQQCETPHPSRYFYIPLIGHHDIPLSVPFREIRDNAKKSLLLTSLLPKPYNVVSQNFWGDGNWNDDCDCLDGSGCQANWTSSAARVSCEHAFAAVWLLWCDLSVLEGEGDSSSLHRDRVRQFSDQVSPSHQLHGGPREHDPLLLPPPLRATQQSVLRAEHDGCQRLLHCELWRVEFLIRNNQDSSVMLFEPIKFQFRKLAGNFVKLALILVT